MSARIPSHILVSLALLLSITSIGWAPPELPVASAATDATPAAIPGVGPEIIISARDSEEHLPAVAYNSLHNEYLVAWENDWGGGYHDVYVQRVSAAGQLLSWWAMTSASGRSEVSPAVAYDPDNDRYLVVWSHDYSGNGADWDIHGRFVRWNGPDPAWPEFEICTWRNQQGQPAVAYNPVAREYLVVWKSSGPSFSHIGTRRVLGSGGFAGDAWLLASGAEKRDSPDVTHTTARNEYLVTYDIEINPGDRDIRGMRLRSDGVPLTGGNPPVIGEFRIADYIGANEWTPAVAACPAADQYLVAWQSDDGTGGADHAIYARYLNGDAVPGNIHLIDDTPYPEFNVDVACNPAGNRYTLAWQRRYANGKYGIWARIAWPNENLRPQFVVQPAGSTTDRVFPAVADGRTGALVAWEHQRDYGGNRDIHGRLLQYAAHLPVILR